MACNEKDITLMRGDRAQVDDPFLRVADEIQITGGEECLVGHIERRGDETVRIDDTGSANKDTVRVNQVNTAIG